MSAHATERTRYLYPRLTAEHHEVADLPEKCCRPEADVILKGAEEHRGVGVCLRVVRRESVWVLVVREDG